MTPPNSESRRQPVFVLAPARSFSTVCVAMLAGHPDIYGFPELLLFGTDTVRGLLTEHQRRLEMPPRWLDARLSGILRAVAEVHEQDQSPAAIDRSYRWLSDHAAWSTVQLMDHLLDLVHPRIGLEKSPDTASLTGAIDACMRAYPHARYLHLTRHPVSTQRSMHRNWASRPVPREGIVRHAASAWHNTHRSILRALSPLPTDRWIRVRAEDLLQQPQIWLPRILGWLDLDCTGQIMTRMLHTEQWRFAGTGQSGRLYGGDSKFMRQPKLRPIDDPGPVRFDPSWELQDRMCAKMQTLATYLGY